MKPGWPVAWLALLLAGSFAAAAGWAVAPRRFAFAWLVSWSFLATTCSGCLALLMIGHASRARWFSAVRRLVEIPTVLLPILAPLAVPLLFFLGELYPWAAPLASLSAEQREAILHQRSWMNLPFFLLRSLVWLGVPCGLALLLRRLSLRQDARPDVALQLRMQRLSAGGLPAIALVLTFASFDGLMALQPTWQSTALGLYVSAGALVGGIALASLLASAFSGSDRVGAAITADHRHALGKLLFTLVITWAWIAFAQFLVSWVADLPHEAAFYRARSTGGWERASLLLGLAHFAVPFLALLPRVAKRRPVPLAAASLWLLGAHWLDLHWLAMPFAAPEGPLFHWIDLGALACFVGAGGLAASLAWRGRALVATGDPYLPEALGYRSP